MCLLRSFGFGKQQSTYDAACLLLALVEHDAFGNHDWILELSDQLKGWQANGAWGYPAGRDLSNTQFGALGLWAASRAGVKVDASVWEDLALAVLEHEGRKGGFSYGYEAPTPTASMTAAGLGTLALCEFQLTLLGELEKFVPLSSKRFSKVASDVDALHATLQGLAGEIVHVTALKPQRGSFVVLTSDVTIGAEGIGQLLLKR